MPGQNYNGTPGPGGPQNMGSPMQALLKYFGIGANNQDIHLPQEGPRDLNLPPLDVNGMLQSGATALNPINGLKKALGR